MRQYYRFIIVFIFVQTFSSCFPNWTKYHPGEHGSLYLKNNSDTTIFYEQIVTRNYDTLFSDDYFYDFTYRDNLYRECFNEVRSDPYGSAEGTLFPGEKGEFFGRGVEVMNDRYMPSCEDRLKEEGPAYLGIFYARPGLLGDEDCVGVFKLTYEVLDTLLHWEPSFPFPDEVERFTIQEFREYSGYDYFTKIPQKYYGKDYEEAREYDAAHNSGLTYPYVYGQVL